MNTERLMLKGRKAELNPLANELILKINANAEAARALLNMAGLVPPDKLDLNGASINLNEAIELQRELNDVRKELTQIEERLA